MSGERKPREPMSNIGLVCPKHAPRSGLMTKVAPEAMVGRYVKKSFVGVDPRNGKEGIEHMWVLIQRVLADGAMEGVLNNDPVFEMKVDCGDTVPRVSLTFRVLGVS